MHVLQLSSSDSFNVLLQGKLRDGRRGCYTNEYPPKFQAPEYTKSTLGG